MGNAPLPKGCCCSSTSDLTAAMDMVAVENGLSPASGLLKELNLTNPLQMQEEVEFDYDLELSAGMQKQGLASVGSRKRLLRAARLDDAPIVLQMVAEGADLALVGEALRLAAYRGSACVVRELVAVGLPVNEACPYTGLTSLQLAAGCGHILVCELLLDAMADVQSHQGQGLTALELARRKGHVEVQEVIERHVAALLLAGKGEEQDEGGAYKRAHVLPRVSPVLSEAVLQALPIPPSSAGHDSVGAIASGSRLANGQERSGGVVMGCMDLDEAAAAFGGSGIPQAPEIGIAECEVPEETENIVEDSESTWLQGGLRTEVMPL
mmetsp:Transcript_56354/g.119929  ORF Transcript_56354/g.119929 Transcript_56354/m.119929 type:complete len:324 (-) Transcript_56354:62-1033(-)